MKIDDLPRGTPIGFCIVCKAVILEFQEFHVVGNIHKKYLGKVHEYCLDGRAGDNDNEP